MTIVKVQTAKMKAIFFILVAIVAQSQCVNYEAQEAYNKFVEVASQTSEIVNVINAVSTDNNCTKVFEDVKDIINWAAKIVTVAVRDIGWKIASSIPKMIWCTVEIAVKPSCITDIIKGGVNQTEIVWQEIKDLEKEGVDIIGRLVRHSTRCIL